ncbi:MAG: 1,4-alpha-glucan branching enzyme, partial [Bacteroidota bacterium]
MAKSKKSKKISNETSDVRTIEFFSLFTDYDIELFKSGKHYRLYEKLGSHIVEHQGASGVYFAVWAPNARYVSVIGNFNSWNKGAHPLQPRWDGSGIWESFIPRIGQGEVYKYFINTKDNEDLEKGDPYAFFWEVPPMTASIVWDLKYKWSDNKWMKKRAAINALNAPISVYEVHLGSWQRSPHHPEKYLDYKHLAKSLTEYVKDMGYTHV